MGPGPLLVPIARAPGTSALVFDVDGVLAPIVARPELSRVPEATRAELARLAERYLLVACLSGREREDLERLVGVEGVRYVGNHGLELDPHTPELAAQIARFRDALPPLPARLEDKRLSLTFHYREATDPAAVEEELAGVAERARAAGLEAFWGRMVLEVRPRVAADKGTALRTLLAGSGATRALYAGDDTTDLDAFGGLVAAGLEHAVRIAVASAEGPPELQAQADLVVESPAALVDVLRTL